MQAVLHWLTEPSHVVYFWCVLSALLNIAFHVHSASDWVAYATKNPKLAVVASMMRAVGVDPVTLLQVVVALVASKAKASKAGFARTRLLVPLGALAIVAHLGCAWFASHPAVAPDSAQAGACVAEHALQGETVVQIAVACSLPVEKVLFDILDSQDPNVGACPAHAEAVHLQMAMGSAEGARLEQMQRDLEQLLHESGLEDAGAH